MASNDPQVQTLQAEIDQLKTAYASLQTEFESVSLALFESRKRIAELEAKQADVPATTTTIASTAAATAHVEEVSTILTAEEVAAMAGAAVHSTGFVYDASTGLYVDPSGLLYNPQTRLYYNPAENAYYYLENDRYQFHSYAVVPEVVTTASFPRLRLFTSMSECVQPGKVFNLSGRGGTIGRDSGLGHDILLKEILVSKEHAEIRFREGQFMVKDNGSRNGTTLDGEVLEEDVWYPLSDLVSLHIGSTKFQIHLHENYIPCASCGGDDGSGIAGGLEDEDKQVLDKEEQRKLEMARLKKLYNIKGVIPEDLPEDQYLDRAEKRRKRFPEKSAANPAASTAGSAPVAEVKNKGLSLIEKMNWKPGQALGKEENGLQAPLVAQARQEKVGIGFGESDAFIITTDSKNAENWRKARMNFKEKFGE